MGRGVVGELVVLPMLPRRPARICIRKSLAAPGLLNRKMILMPPLVPMSLRVSKYWVRRTRAMTSSAVAPGTDSRKCSMEERRPSMMGLTLGGDALALEGLGLSLGFGLLDLEDFFGFASGLRGDLGSLGGVDVVHRGFDLDVGDDVGDECGEDVEAEAGHDGVELGFDIDGDAGLLLEGLVEGELGDVAEDAVEDEGLDLLLRGAELVEGVVDLVVEDLVLDGDGDLDEDVVAGLGLDGELGLLDLEVDDKGLLGEGDEDLEAGADDAVELAEALDDAGGVGADGEEGFEDRDQGDEGEDDDGDEQEGVQDVHGRLTLWGGYMRGSR